MIIIAVTFVPFFHNASIFTAYEYLERRFDAKTRAFTALLFLLSRGLSCSVIISAPAVVLSVMLGLDVTTDLSPDRCADGDLHDARRRPGGGVDRRQADVPDRVRPGGRGGRADARPAGHRQRRRGAAASPAPPAGCASSTSPPIRALRYTFWTGTIGALFLFLSYFGTDQSQVQRYLSAKSINEARTSLFMSAYWKIPLQALVMIIGVLMFVFYVFMPPPMLFNRAARPGRVEQPAGRGLRRRRGEIRRRRRRPPRCRRTARRGRSRRRSCRVRLAPQRPSMPKTSAS